MHFTPERALELGCELYESLEEVKGRLFRLFAIPKDLLPHMGFYEVLESERHFEETFVEDFVRAADVAAGWELRAQQAPLRSARLYFCFRYYLTTEDPSFVLRKVEKCFLVADLLRLLHCNRVPVAIDDFNQVVAMLLRMRRFQVHADEMPRLVPEAREAIRFYGQHSDFCVRSNHRQVLAQLKVFEFDKPFILKNNLLQLMKNLGCYRVQCFEVQMTARTVRQHGMELRMTLLVGPAGLALNNGRKAMLFACNYDYLRTVLLKEDVVHLVFNTEADERGETGGEGTDQPEEDKSSASEPFVEYLTFSFTACQASSIYVTIQNYISLQLTGMYKAGKINGRRLYADVDQVSVGKEELGQLATQGKRSGRHSRFHK